MKERELQKYLRKCRLLPVEPGPVVAGFRCAAVIPACDELEEIGNTLASLAPGADDMVLLVVNHPADAPSRVKAASGELLPAAGVRRVFLPPTSSGSTPRI